MRAEEGCLKLVGALLSERSVPIGLGAKLGDDQRQRGIGSLQGVEVWAERLDGGVVPAEVLVQTQRVELVVDRVASYGESDVKGNQAAGVEGPG
jgi:hypothetical protein